MAQVDILELLESKKLPLSVREISELLKEDYTKVTKQVFKLFKNDEIKCLEVDRKKALKYFGSKRKLRLYFVSKFNNRKFQ